MFLDKDGSLGYGEMKGFNRDPSLCGKADNCVKICPQQAIRRRGVMPTSSLWAPALFPFVGSEDINVGP